MASSRISELSSIIARDTAVIEAYCRKNDIPSPSLDINAPPTVVVPPSEPAVAAAKDNIEAASRELLHLMQGPEGFSSDIGILDAFVFHAISRFKISELLPVGGELSFAEISEKCGVNVSSLKRVLRFAMTDGYFCEKRPGYVSHTSLSRVTAENPLFSSGRAFTYEESFSAAAKATDALERYSNSEEPTLSGWGLANQAKMPMFEELHSFHPERHRNASIAMDAWNSSVHASPLVDNYSWGDVDTVVDVGGGHGHVSLSIAKRHSRPKFVVQDLAGVVAEGRGGLPPEYQERISFMAHDMFTEQPIKNADVYLFRSVFHDWPDKYCVRMLQSLIPALKPGAKIVINDSCMPPPGTLHETTDRGKRKWDLYMMVLFNARDRENGEWEELFSKADKRFKYLGSRLPDENVEGLSHTFLLNIIEAVWSP